MSLLESAGFKPGKNIIQLLATDKNSLPYTLTWSYRMRKPANDANAPVKITASLNAEQAKEGDSIQLKTRVENVSGNDQGMAVAVIGLPGGLALPDDLSQLKALAQPLEAGAKAGKIDAWELRGRELILYWRGLPAGAKVEIELDLVCRLPGTFRGPASLAYLYYDPDRKFWLDPLAIRVFAAD